MGLSQRLDRLESVALPDDELLYCTIYIEEDGTISEMNRPNPRCPHALVRPIDEICEKCKACKMIMQLVGGRED